MCRTTSFGSMEFACDLCDKTFAARYLLNRHLVTHTRVRNYLCPVCGQAFLQSSALNRHAASHESRLAYRCNECCKRFNRSSTRDVHQASHGAKAYVCKSCGKAFHQKSTLKTHELIHTDTKPFSCCYCGTTFRQHSNLRVHVSRRHKGRLECLRNNSIHLSSKKEEDTQCIPKLGQDLTKQRGANSRKLAERCQKEKFLFVSESSQVCDADIVDKGNSRSSATIQGNCNDASKTSSKEAHVTELQRCNRMYVPALAVEYARKTSHSSTLSAARKKLGSNCDLEDESENEEYPSFVEFSSDHLHAVKFESCDSAVCLNAKKEFDSKNDSRHALSSTPCCKAGNETYVALTGGKTLCQLRDAATSTASNSVADQRVADEIPPTADNHGKVATSKDAATAVFSYSAIPTQKHPLPIWPLTDAIEKEQVEVTKCIRYNEKILKMSDAFTLSFSLLPESSINFHKDNSLTSKLFSTTFSRWDAQLSPEQPNDTLPNVENMIANVFKSCRQTSGLISPLMTDEQRVVPSKQKIASKTRSGDFSSSRKPSDRHLHAKASANNKLEKIMYLKLFTPEKPVKEFIWSCGLK